MTSAAAQSACDAALARCVQPHAPAAHPRQTGDRFGRRRLLVAGTALFALASLGCALAPDDAWLLGGRLLQGVGAAMLLPNSLAILGTTFSGRAKGRAVGVWAAAAPARRFCHCR